MTPNTKIFTQRFKENEGGSVAIMFALIFSVLILIVGMAVDHSRLIGSNTKIAAAADSAALAAARAMLDGRLSDDDVRQVGRAYFNTNMASDSWANINGVNINPNRTTGAVTVTVDADVPMTFTRVAGFDSFDLPVQAATRFDQKDIELGMALDVTGSMAGSKITDLKLASKDLINILLPDGGSTNKVRIGLAPYAAGVNAGSYARTVTGGASGGCVHERGGTERFTDSKPVSGSWLGYTSRMPCPSATIEPLSTDKNLLKSRIDTYRASGGTAGHLGAAWAWYLISPEWKDFFPVLSRPTAYGAANTVKAIILMTDGEFNTQYVGANGSSSNQARGVCGEMKDKGVVVYSVAFQSPSAAESLLRNCATSENHYFNARDGEELRGAFQSIAANLNNLRLTQ